jgi:hypothetical protein
MIMTREKRVVTLDIDNRYLFLLLLQLYDILRDTVLLPVRLTWFLVSHEIKQKTFMLLKQRKTTRIRHTFRIISKV